MTPPDEEINTDKANAIIAQLVRIAEGPREAYGILCLAIYLLNFEVLGAPVSIDQLANDVGSSLRSIKGHLTQ